MFNFSLLIFGNFFLIAGQKVIEAICTDVKEKSLSLFYIHEHENLSKVLKINLNSPMAC